MIHPLHRTEHRSWVSQFFAWFWLCSNQYCLLRVLTIFGLASSNTMYFVTTVWQYSPICPKMTSVVFTVADMILTDLTATFFAASTFSNACIVNMQACQRVSTLQTQNNWPFIPATSRYTARWPLWHAALTDNYRQISQNEAFSLVCTV